MAKHGNNNNKNIWIYIYVYIYIQKLNKIIFCGCISLISVTFLEWNIIDIPSTCLINEKNKYK